MRVIGILLCAGSGVRMGFNKLAKPLCGKTAMERSMDALTAGGVTELIAVATPENEAVLRSIAAPVPVKIVAGGETRGESVKNGLRAVGGRISPEDVAVIHDAARCFVSPEVVRRTVESAAARGSGIAVLPVTDSMFRQEGETVVPVPRENVFRTQTPQSFRYLEILEAYEADGGLQTDDAAVYRSAGRVPVFVRGSEENGKLTSPEDWREAERRLTRYGTGFDTHCLTEGRKLILGGVEIPFEKGLLGHSDADVLTHAVMDALLGAACLKDIGHQFPDTDDRYLGADSLELLRRVAGLLADKGLRPFGIDATVIAQRPKMAPYLDEMRRRLAEAAGISPEQVSLKATTTEGMNDEGKGLCISASAIASVI